VDPVAPVAPCGPAGPGDAVTHALNASAANAAVNSFEYLMMIPLKKLRALLRAVIQRCKIRAMPPPLLYASAHSAVYLRNGKR
jgi:hypothetical protein